MSVIYINDSNFDSVVLNSEIPVLVDFWAEWCGPCKMLAPVIEEIADEMDGQIVAGKLNIDESESLARDYNIMSIPTVMLFKQGKVVGQIVGAQPKANIMKIIRESV